MKKDSEPTRPYGRGYGCWDIKMDGLLWEIKNPHSNGKRTLDHAMQHALKQSNNVIIDLRKCKIPPDKAIRKLVKDFHIVKKIKHLIIITTTQYLTFNR